LKTEVQRLQLEESIIFLNYLSEDELPTLYSSASLFLLLGTKEGFGLPPLESMACGTPVIVSNQGALLEVVGTAGITVNPFDYHEIGVLLMKALSDFGLRKALINRGLIRAEKFTWAKTAQKTLEVYNEVLN